MEYKNDFKCSSSARSADCRPNTVFERGKQYADQAASESTRNLKDQTASKSEDIADSPQKNCRRKKVLLHNRQDFFAAFQTAEPHFPQVLPIGKTWQDGTRF